MTRDTTPSRYDALAARLEAHAHVHATHQPQDTEQQVLADDLRLAAQAVRMVATGRCLAPYCESDCAAYTAGLEAELAAATASKAFPHGQPVTLMHQSPPCAHFARPMTPPDGDATA